MVQRLSSKLSLQAKGLFFASLNWVLFNLTFFDLAFFPFTFFHIEHGFFHLMSNTTSYELQSGTLGFSTADGISNTRKTKLVCQNL